MKHLPRAFSAALAVVLVIALVPTLSVFASGDTVGPVTSGVVAAPNPALWGAAVTVTATVDDTTTGASNIQSAEFSVNGGAWTAMTASDGAFDAVTEGVTGAFTAALVGNNQVCVQGTDAAGNVGAPACANFAVQSIYKFKGFSPPVKMSGNNAQAARAVPLKWSLNMTVGGSPVSDPASIIAVKSYSVDCTTLVGDLTTAVVEKAPGNSGLRYLGSGKWIFNWKTSKSYAGSCREVFVLLADGSMSPTVLFRFK